MSGSSGDCCLSGPTYKITTFRSLPDCFALKLLSDGLSSVLDLIPGRAGQGRAGQGTMAGPSPGPRPRSEFHSGRADVCRPGSVNRVALEVTLLIMTSASASVLTLILDRAATALEAAGQISPFSAMINHWEGLEQVL